MLGQRRNLYSISYCRPTRDPRMSVSQLNGSSNMSWKKKFVCDISGKKMCFCSGRKKKFCFLDGRKKNNLIGKKNHTLPPGIKWSAPKPQNGRASAKKSHFPSNHLGLLPPRTRAVHHSSSSPPSEHVAR